MPRLASWTLALGIAALSTSCGDGDGGASGPIDGDPVPPDDAPDAAASTFCTAWVDCDCADYSDQFMTAAECDAAIEADVAAQIEAGEAAGLEYDAECFGDLLAAYESIECRSIADVIDDVEAFVDLYATCKPFHGDDAAGEPCTEPEDVSGDSCAQGLACEDGVCRSRVLVDEGADCMPGDICASGSYCVPVETADAYVCTALPGLGSTCLGVLDLCDAETYCDQGTKNCIALPAIGQACAATGGIFQNRCAGDGVCEDETCVAPPAAGEPCTDRCASGSSCVDDVCRVEPPLICGAEFD